MIVWALPLAQIFELVSSASLFDHEDIRYGYGTVVPQKHVYMSLDKKLWHDRNETHTKIVTGWGDTFSLASNVTDERSQCTGSPSWQITSIKAHKSSSFYKAQEKTSPLRISRGRLMNINGRSSLNMGRRCDFPLFKRKAGIIRSRTPLIITSFVIGERWEPRGCSEWSIARD